MVSGEDMRKLLGIITESAQPQPVEEKAPPGKKAKRFIQKHKDEFRDRYGKAGDSVLYATAWKKFNEGDAAPKPTRGSDMRDLLNLTESHKTTEADVPTSVFEAFKQWGKAEDDTEETKVDEDVAPMMVPPRMTKHDLAVLASQLGMRVFKDRDTGEFVVNFKGGKEESAYYTNDIVDAADTLKAMAKWRDEQQAKAQAEVVGEDYDEPYRDYDAAGEAADMRDHDEEPEVTDLSWSVDRMGFVTITDPHSGESMYVQGEDGHALADQLHAAADEAACNQILGDYLQGSVSEEVVETEEEDLNLGFEESAMDDAFPKPSYFVKDGHTLGSVDSRQPHLFSPLGAMVTMSSHDPKNGPVAFDPNIDKVVPATLADFEKFRVSPKGHIA